MLYKGRTICLWEEDTFQTAAFQGFQCFARWAFPCAELTKIPWGICHCSTAELLAQRQLSPQGRISRCGYLFVRDWFFTCSCSLNAYCHDFLLLAAWRPSTYLHTVYRRLLTVQKGKKKQEITVRMWPAAACISRENYVHLHTMTKKSLGISHWYFHQKGTLLVCIDLSTSFYYYAEVFIIMQKILERAANCVCCKHVKRQTIIFAIV